MRFVQMLSSIATTLALGFLPVPGGDALLIKPAMAADKATKIVINIPSRNLWVYEGEKIVKWYPVGVGRSGFITPIGQYKVIRKVVNPVWEHPYKPSGAVRIGVGRNNPLGTRWIGFKQYKGGEYGIHGTDNPGSVGRFSSHGCVRMKVRDAEDLFERVDVGTPVEVVYDVALIRPHGNDIRLVVYPDHFRKGTPTVEEMREKILQQFPEAQLDLQKLAAALKHPAQKPVVVGSVLPPTEGIMATE